MKTKHGIETFFALQLSDVMIICRALREAGVRGDARLRRNPNRSGCSLPSFEMNKIIRFLHEQLRDDHPKEWERFKAAWPGNEADNFWFGPAKDPLVQLIEKILNDGDVQFSGNKRVEYVRELDKVLKTSDS